TSPPPSPPQSSILSSTPPLPPKTSETPPPPPPISECYYTEDSDLSESDDEHRGKYRSITSTSLNLKSPAEDDVLAVTPGPERTDSPLSNDSVPSPTTPLSSEEDTPRRISQFLVPHQTEESSEIMVVTPEPSLWILDGDTWVEREGNYVNQEVIDESTGGVQEGDCTNQEVIKETKIGKQEGNYANQEIIAGAASGNEEGDHSNQEIIAGAASDNEEGDYANQEIIALAASGNEEGDYANQEIIALAASGNEEGDYANQVIIDENCSKESDYDDDSKLRTVRGAMPIRSRTLTPERSDYMNQELLDGDIIPLSLAVPSSSATALGAGSILQGDTWTRKTPDYANVSGEEDDGREQKETPVDLRVDSREPSRCRLS
ncbi:hypothetical protein GBAR_LOCUS21186, partial [Geodia barretti]